MAKSESWGEGLSRGGITPRGEASDAAIERFRELGAGSMCPFTEETLDHWLREMDSGAHRSILKGSTAIIGDMAAGHSGGNDALRQLRDAFFAVATDRRDPETEFQRAVHGAIARVVMPADEVVDPCGAGNSRLGQVFDRTELGTIPKPVPLIEGWVYKRTAMVLAGDTGTDKSFIMTGWACSAATGKPWLGHKVFGGPAPAILVIGEGAGGLDDRISAWEQENGVRVPRGMLTIYRLPPTIIDDGYWEELTDDAVMRGARFIGHDTFSSLATRASEIDDAAYTVRKMTDTAMATDGVVVLAVHTPLADPKRPRGGTQFIDNSDMLAVASKTGESDDAPVELWLRKDKDGPCGRKMYLARKVVPIVSPDGEALHDETGRARTSCVLANVDPPAGTARNGQKSLTKGEMMEVTGAWMKEHGPATRTVIVREVWTENPGTGIHKWQSALDAMVEEGDAVECKVDAWVERKDGGYRRKVGGLTLRPGWPKITPLRAGS